MTAHPGAGVPLCDLRAQYATIGPLIEEAVLRVLASGQVILGPEVTALEAEIAHYCGTAYGVGCASGTDAVLLALHALEIGPGDEVILPPYTFFATAGTIARGLTIWSRTTIRPGWILRSVAFGRPITAN